MKITQNTIRVLLFVCLLPGLFVLVLLLTWMPRVLNRGKAGNALSSLFVLWSSWKSWLLYLSRGWDFQKRLTMQSALMFKMPKQEDFRGPDFQKAINRNYCRFNACKNFSRFSVCPLVPLGPTDFSYPCTTNSPLIGLFLPSLWHDKKRYFASTTENPIDILAEGSELYRNQKALLWSKFATWLRIQSSWLKDYHHLGEPKSW